MQPIDPPQYVKTIRDCGPIKVWSVILTILADLPRDESDWVTGPVLGTFVSYLGIHNQALRVALHRLRREGVVITQKRGRLSAHRLSAESWLTAQEALATVYEAQSDANTQTSLLIGAPTLSNAQFDALIPQGAIRLSNRTALVCDITQAPENCVLNPFAPSSMPDWVLETIAPKVMRAEYDELASAVQSALARPVPETVLERTVLRVVILYQWRQLRLKHGDVQDQVLPSDWEGAQAREAVTRALKIFQKPVIDALAQRVPLE
jgi:phenylacetic acid degradation operon negative regulatory protein